MRNGDTQTLSEKIILYFDLFLVFRQVNRAIISDGLINRVCETCFVNATLLIVAPACVRRHIAFGSDGCAGFIPP